MTTRRLIVFAREPQPGRVKTRLARDIGDSRAAQLYAAMLDDVLATAAALRGFRTMIFWATENGKPPEHYRDMPCEHFVQTGSDLGERMINAFSTAFSGETGSCCIIGSDSPDLPPEYLCQAFDLLEQGSEAVFGPADDGGYYLAGMRRLIPELFSGIEWGAATVLDESCRRAREQGVKTAFLPGWYDIDTLADLRRLTGSRGETRSSRLAAALLAGLP